MRFKLNLTHGLLCTLLVVQVLAVARAPTPYCVSKPLYKQLPLTYEEILTYDMDIPFSGYNLFIHL
jgi:hypothetical protein